MRYLVKIIDRASGVTTHKACFTNKMLAIGWAQEFEASDTTLKFMVLELHNPISESGACAVIATSRNFGN